MTIRHLQIFIEVAQCQKMSEAAKRLFITQPSVSGAIKELEQEYGVKLFERLNKKLYITPAGQTLLDYARHIVRLSGEMEVAMKNESSAQALAIGATVTVGTCLMGPLLQAFYAQHPQASAKVRVENTAQILQKIAASELDAAIVEGQVSTPDVISWEIFQDEMVLLCAPSHPFAQQKEVSLAQLAGEGFVLREKGSGTRELFCSIMQQQGLRVEETWVCNNSQAILNAVALGQGLTVISRLLARDWLQNKRVCEVKVRGYTFGRWFHLVYHKNKFISQTLGDFIELARDKQKIAQMLA